MSHRALDFFAVYKQQQKLESVAPSTHCQVIISTMIISVVLEMSCLNIAKIILIVCYINRAFQRNDLVHLYRLVMKKH